MEGVFGPAGHSGTVDTEDIELSDLISAGVVQVGDRLVDRIDPAWPGSGSG